MFFTPQYDEARKRYIYLTLLITAVRFGEVGHVRDFFRTDWLRPYTEHLNSLYPRLYLDAVRLNTEEANDDDTDGDDNPTIALTNSPVKAVGGKAMTNIMPMTTIVTVPQSRILLTLDNLEDAMRKFPSAEFNAFLSAAAIEYDVSSCRGDVLFEKKFNDIKNPNKPNNPMEME